MLRKGRKDKSPLLLLLLLLLLDEEEEGGRDATVEVEGVELLPEEAESLREGGREGGKEGGRA